MERLFLNIYAIEKGKNYESNVFMLELYREVFDVKHQLNRVTLERWTVDA